MRAPLWPALAALALLVSAWGVTLEERTRCGRIEPRLALAGPSIACPTGYDGLGRCVGRSLMGGVHGFLLPGLLAALLAGLGGALGGLAAGYTGTAAGFAGTAAGYKGSVTGYPGTAAGYAGTLAGYLWTAMRSVTRAVLLLIEALPRLVVLLLVWMLWEQSLMALGVALGAVMVPSLAAEVAGKMRWLEQQDFIRAARAHGIAEHRIVLHHLLYLSCGAIIVRHMFFTFGHMVVVETTLSYALQSGLEAGGCSWGGTLQRSLFALYDALAGLEGWIDDPVRHPLHWPAGLSQFLATVAAVVGVLWAVLRAGEWVERGGLSR